MQFLRDLLDSQHDKFTKGGKLEKFYPIYEMIDTFLYTPGDVTSGKTHVRDGLDLKRMMVTVAMALMPCILMALYNTGYQANKVLAATSGSLEGWRGSIYSALSFSHDPNSLIGNMVLGALFFVPVFLVTNIVGGL
jgi:Na+-transporting NADH:ubiquinone oxidoreductase subunit B